MNIDLSSSGMTLPLLVAAGVAVLLYALSGKKDEAAADPAKPLTDWLTNLLGSGSKAGWVSLVLLLWNNRSQLVDVVKKAMEQLKRIIDPPKESK